MKIDIVKLDELNPLEKNVRTHSEKQIEELARSVQQFGQTRAMVIDENNNVLIGNALFYAMRKLGLESVECYRITGLSENEKKKLVLSDNRIYALGRDDFPTINEFVTDITSAGDFDIAGFDTYILEQMTISRTDALTEAKSYGTIAEDSKRHTQGELPPKYNRKYDNITAEEASRQEQSSQTYTQAEGQPNTVANHEEPPKVERRMVICPNCGEVIYLD